MGGKDDGGTIGIDFERLARFMRAHDHGEGLNPAQREALRYLSRANRFSNSPGALTRYLGATKGTISQTVKALERKGFLIKTRREGQQRSVALVLTAGGEMLLGNDPWMRLASAIDRLRPKIRRRLAKGLRELLISEVRRGDHASFGCCPTCRYFREKGRDGDPRGPHFCMLFEQPIAAAETSRICVEYHAE